MIKKLVPILFFALMISCSNKPIEPINLNETIKVLSPGKTVHAILYTGKANNGWNLLGSDIRWYLGISNNEYSYILLKDLGEGFGTYEGGVINIHWINNDEIFIDRMISDQTKNIIYNIREMKWKDVQ